LISCYLHEGLDGWLENERVAEEERAEKRLRIAGKSSDQSGQLEVDV